MKVKAIIERLVICYYVLTSHTFYFFSSGKEPFYKKGMACYEQNTFLMFEETIIDFLENNKSK